MKPVFALGLLLAATTAGAAPAQFGQDLIPTSFETAYAPDASVVTNPDADATPTLSGVEWAPAYGTTTVPARLFFSTSG